MESIIAFTLELHSLGKASDIRITSFDPFITDWIADDGILIEIHGAMAVFESQVNVNSHVSCRGIFMVIAIVHDNFTLS